MQPSSRLDLVVLMVQIQEDIKLCSWAPGGGGGGGGWNQIKGHDEDDCEKNVREDAEEGQEGGVSSGNSSHLCSSSALLCEGRLEARCAPLPAESPLHRRHLKHEKSTSGRGLRQNQSASPPTESFRSYGILLQSGRRLLFQALSHNLPTGTGSSCRDTRGVLHHAEALPAEVTALLPALHNVSLLVRDFAPREVEPYLRLSPPPGGVGPLAVSRLFDGFIDLCVSWSCVLLLRVTRKDFCNHLDELLDLLL
ncbi:hypothetical protein EYF80_023353 [Liparis tanakae]|uniref:Uncharacterized protein n=1 Tax=Liparis tanakae TaxID=230148 RepID=A0A4Z2HMD9_9TELE|nr:hypothetical protein EYF80_023353 [Liparis tanakae]